MKRMKILKLPTRLTAALFEDEQFETLEHDWEAKSRRLQARRWRRLKQQMI